MRAPQEPLTRSAVKLGREQIKCTIFAFLGGALACEVDTRLGADPHLYKSRFDGPAAANPAVELMYPLSCATVAPPCTIMSRHWPVLVCVHR